MLEDIETKVTNGSYYVVSDELKIDSQRKLVWVSGTQIYLTGQEFIVLELLCKFSGEVVTTYMILNRLYGGGEAAAPKIVSVVISKLNKKLAIEGKKYIRSVWGRGYQVVRSKDEPVRKLPLVSPKGRVTVRRITGEVLCINELPKRGERWTVRKKADVLSAIYGGLVTAKEACVHYGITKFELSSWNYVLRNYGLRGLRAKALQELR